MDREIYRKMYRGIDGGICRGIDRVTDEGTDRRMDGRRNGWRYQRLEGWSGEMDRRDGFEGWIIGVDYKAKLVDGL